MKRPDKDKKPKREPTDSTSVEGSSYSERLDRLAAEVEVDDTISDELLTSEDDEDVQSPVQQYAAVSDEVQVEAIDIESAQSELLNMNPMAEGLQCDKQTQTEPESAKDTTTAFSSSSTQLSQLSNSSPNDDDCDVDEQKYPRVDGEGFTAETETGTTRGIRIFKDALHAEDSKDSKDVKKEGDPHCFKSEGRTTTTSSGSRQKAETDSDKTKRPKAKASSRSRRKAPRPHSAKPAFHQTSEESRLVLPNDDSSSTYSRTPKTTTSTRLLPPLTKGWPSRSRGPMHALQPSDSSSMRRPTDSVRCSPRGRRPPIRIPRRPPLLTNPIQKEADHFSDTSTNFVSGVNVGASLDVTVPPPMIHVSSSSGRRSVFSPPPGFAAMRPPLALSPRTSLCLSSTASASGSEMSAPSPMPYSPSPRCVDVSDVDNCAMTVTTAISFMSPLPPTLAAGRGYGRGRGRGRGHLVAGRKPPLPPSMSTMAMHPPLRGYPPLSTDIMRLTECPPRRRRTKPPMVVSQASAPPMAVVRNVTADWQQQYRFQSAAEEMLQEKSEAPVLHFFKGRRGRRGAVASGHSQQPPIFELQFDMDVTAVDIKPIVAGDYGGDDDCGDDTKTAMDECTVEMNDALLLDATTTAASNSVVDDVAVERVSEDVLEEDAKCGDKDTDSSSTPVTGSRVLPQTHIPLIPVSIVFVDCDKDVVAVASDSGDDVEEANLNPTALTFVPGSETVWVPNARRTNSSSSGASSFVSPLDSIEEDCELV